MTIHSFSITLKWHLLSTYYVQCIYFKCTTSFISSKKYKVGNYLYFVDNCFSERLSNLRLITNSANAFFFNCLKSTFNFNFLFFLYFFHLFIYLYFGQVACGILVPRPGIKPVSPALEGIFFTTGSWGKSPIFIFNDLFLCLYIL